MTTIASPVLVEVPNNIITPRTIPNALKARLDVPAKSSDAIAADAAKTTERRRLLREAHIEEVKDRALRHIARAEETVARRIREEANEASSIAAKVTQTPGRSASWSLAAPQRPGACPRTPPDLGRNRCAGWPQLILADA